MSQLSAAVSALDDSQRAAFEVDSHCAVIAPPGSGKTRLLVAKLAHTLANDVMAPQGAACITLTNNAATEVQQRFDRISSDTRSNIFIGTVHGFSYRRIVRPYASLLGHSHLTTARLGKAAEMDEIWEEALNAAAIPRGERTYLRPSVDKFRSLLATETEWKTLGKYPIAARDAFLERMDARGLLDFGRMIEHAVTFVESESVVREGLSATFPRLFVDEYQDLAPGLDRIVRTLAFGVKLHKSILFAVGDVDQAIYRWTGTDPKLLLNLASLPSVTERRLSTNYRSGAHLVGITRRLLNTGPAPSTTRNGGKVSVHQLPAGMQDQCRFVADTALALSASGVPFQEMAVFCATNAIGAQIASGLATRGVPAYFRTAADWETPLSILIERICAWAAHGQDESGHRMRQMSAELVRTVEGISPSSVRAIWARAILVAPTDSAADFVTEVATQLKINAKPGAITSIDEDLAGLREATASGELSGSSISTVGSRRVTADKVYLTTLTSSKGLEFDHTFVLGLEDGQIPFYRSINDVDQLAEERRKFYVAVTRAREHVYLLWSGFNVNPNGRKFSNPISRFVSELGTLEQP
jgi:DNA helicase-2/ATP-dependent DNA helicase PcrA